MHRSPFPSELVLAAMLVIVAVGLVCAPERVSGPVRGAVRTALLPGQLAVNRVMERGRTLLGRFADAEAREAERTALQDELTAWKLRSRQWQLEAALLHEQLGDEESSGLFAVRGSPGEPLIVPELVEASVLGEEHAALWRSGRLIDKGRLAGVGESALVLEGTGPLIDQGENAGLETAHPVYAGRCVVGRIARVGRWSSSVQRVTDRDYRGLAQLVRPTSQGPLFGARGVLEGDGGPLCRMKYVAVTEPVSEGDAVYTADRDGLLPYPMYYGKVVRAEADPASPHWDIWIEPAAASLDLRKVQILRKSANPRRTDFQVRP